MKQSSTPTSAEKTNATASGKQQSFFGPQLQVNQVNDTHEQEADRVAGEVMRTPATGQFFTPAPKSIQREENPGAEDQTGKVLSEGAGVAYEQLEENAAFKAWKEKQTEKLKYKLWDSQSTEYKAGMITFGALNAGILGSVFAMDPKFRSGAINTLEGINILSPLKLVPYSEFFGLSGFKYKLPSAENSPYTFNTEFTTDAWFDVMRKHWNIPQVNLGVGVDSAYSKEEGFKPFTGGSIKIKLGGGIINVQGFLNHTLPPIPMLVTDPSKGERPTWIMRSLPDQLESNLPAGSGVFITVDVLRLPELFNGGGGKETEEPSYRKSVEVNRKENNSSSTIDHSASGKVTDVLSSGNGRPLENDTRHFMEHRFNQDFSNVRIHTNNEAAESAQSVNAKAFTSGKDIVFDTGKYQPDTDAGKNLLAHELVHVVQQTGTIQRKTGDGATTASDAAVAQQIREKLELGNYSGAWLDVNDNTDGWTNIGQKKEWLRKHNDIRKMFLRQLPASVVADVYSAEELTYKTPPATFAILDCWYQAEEEKRLLYAGNLPLFDFLLQTISPYTGASMQVVVEQLAKRINTREYISDTLDLKPNKNDFGNAEFHIIHLLAPTIDRKFKFYRDHNDLFKVVRKKFDPFTGISTKTFEKITDTNEVGREEALKIYNELKKLPDEQRRAFFESALLAGTLEADKDAEAWYKKNFKAQYKELPHNWDSAIMPWNWGGWDAPFAERLTADHVAMMSSALNFEDTATRKFGFDPGIDMKPFEKNGKMTSDATRLIKQMLEDANFSDPNRLVLLLAIGVRAGMEEEIRSKVLLPKSKENKITPEILPLIESYGFIAAKNFDYVPDKAVTADHDKSLGWYIAKRTIFKGKTGQVFGEHRATVSVNTLQETSSMHGALGGMRFGTMAHDGDAYYNNAWLEKQVKENPGSETLLPNIEEFKGNARVGKVFASIRPSVRQANIYASVLPIQGLNYFAAGSLYRSGEGVLQGLSINMSWTKDPSDPENSVSLTLGIENFSINNVQLIAPKSTLAIGNIGVKGLRFTIDKNKAVEGYTALGLFRDANLTVDTLMTLVPAVMKLIPFAIMTMTEEFKGAKVHVYKEALGALMPADFATLRASLTFTSVEVKNMYDTMAGFLDDFSIEQRDDKGNLVRQGLVVKESLSWQTDAMFDIKGRIRSIDNKIRSMKAALANVDDDKKLEALEIERQKLLKEATNKSIHYESRDEEMNRLRQIYRQTRELNAHLQAEFEKAIPNNPAYDRASFTILEKEKKGLEENLDYLENHYFEDKKLLEESGDRIERFETRKRLAEFEAKYKSVDVTMRLRGITLKGGNYVRDLINDSLRSLGFESPTFEGLENINIGEVNSDFTVSGKGASSVKDKPGVAIRKLHIPLIKAPAIFFKTEKMQLKADQPRLNNVFVSVSIDFVANPLDRDPAVPYKYRLSSLFIEKAHFNSLQLFMGSDIPLLDFPAGMPVDAWGIHLWDYDPESGNINLRIRDVKAQGAYKDKNEAAKTDQAIDFGIDTTLDNNTEAGKKPAIDIRYNQEEDSVVSKLNIASAWISGMDVQSPTLHVSSLPGVNAIEVKNILADVKVYMSRPASDPKGARPMIIEINTLNIGEATAQGISLQLFEETESTATDPKKKTTGRKVQEVTLPKQDKVSIKNIRVSGLRVTLGDAATTLSTIDKDASVQLGPTDLGGIKYTEKSAKGSVLRAVAIHSGKFNALSLEALGRNGREYSLKEFLKFFGRTRLEGLEASASYNDGKTSASVGITGKKNIPISIDYHEPTEEGKPDYYSMRLPLSRVNLPALHVMKEDHEIIIAKPTDKAYTSYLSDVDVKLRAYVEFGENDKVNYDIYLDSLDVADMAVYGLEYHNKKKGVDVVFEKTKPLHIPNIKAGGFRFSSSTGFGVFGKAGGWANIAAGTEMIEASFDSIKAALETGEFLATKVPGYTNSALDIDIAQLGFHMDSDDNMTITLGTIRGAFPTLNITQTDPKTSIKTTTKISSLTKTISAQSVVIKLNADTSKEIDAFGIEAGGLQLLSTDTKGGSKLSKTKITLFDKKGMNVDSTNVKLNADNSKEITLKGIHGGHLNVDLTSYDTTGTSIKEIRLPDPNHVQVESVTIKIDDKGNKKIVVEKPTLRNFSLRMPSTEKTGDYTSVRCDLVVEGTIEMGDGDFATMALGAPYDAFVLNVPDSVPVQVKNLRLEYKDTKPAPPGKAEPAKGLTPDQQRLLDMEKAKDDAYSEMLSTPAEIYGPNDSSYPNPDWDAVVKKYNDAVSAYDAQKAKMIGTAKAEAAGSMTKKYLDAVDGSATAKIRIFDSEFNLNIETYLGEKYVEISDDVATNLKSMLRSIVASTGNMAFWSSADMKAIGEGLKRWYLRFFTAPTAKADVDNIAAGNAWGVVQLLLRDIEMWTGTLESDAKMFGLNMNLEGYWALDITSYDSIGVGLCENKYKHPLKDNFFNLYGFVEYLNYVSPALASLSGQQDAARMKSLKDGFRKTEAEISDMGIGDAVKELVAFIQFSLAQEAKALGNTIKKNIKGVDVTADVTLSPQEVITELLKEKKQGSLTFDKGKTSIDNLHIDGGYSRGRNPEVKGTVGSGTDGKDNIIIPGATYLSQDKGTKVSYDGLEISPLNITYNDDVLKLLNDSMQLKGLKVGVKKK